MKNTFTTPADFWQERDFAPKINATFDFVKAHWRPLGKCLVYFVTPASLLLGIGTGLFTNPLYSQMGKTMAAQRTGTVPAVAPTNPFAVGSTALGMGLAFVGGLLAFVLLLGTVYGYLRARLELPATEPVTPAAVGAQLRRRLGKMLLVLLVLAGGYVALSLGIGVLFGVLAAIGGGGGAIAGAVLGGLAFFAGAIYLVVTLALYFPVLWLEDVSVFGAFRRSFQLIKGQWWATFGVLLVMSFIQGSLSVVFIIPFYASLAGKMFQLPILSSDVAGLVGSTFYAVGVMFMYVLTLLVAAFQYFNLAERREGHGLRLLVAGLGQGQAAPTAYSQHYRPEEEGEY